jgi:hypothetical protein
MAKSFKKNQPIVATLPTGRVVEGIYIEPYGTDGHSFYVDEYDGERGGKPVFRKVQYGVKEEFIDAADVKTSAASDAQYKAWLKRAMILEERIKDDKKALKKATSDADKEKLQKKIERSQSKLDQINEKIDEFEGEE